MPFEQFTRKLIPLGKAPVVTIQKRGSLSLNASAYQALGSPKAVHLLYDREEQIIGLRAADPDDPNSYPARNGPNRAEFGPWVVSAQAFTNYYKIDTSPRRLPAALQGDILCADLKRHVATSSNQNGRANGTAGSG